MFIIRGVLLHNIKHVELVGVQIIHLLLHKTELGNNGLR